MPFSYHYVVTDAAKNGITKDTVQNNVRRASKLTEREARQILGVTEETPWEEIVKVSLSFVSQLLSIFVCKFASNICTMQKYDTLFEKNAKNESFYLQSKVHRAKEYLEAVQRDKGQGNP